MRNKSRIPTWIKKVLKYLFSNKKTLQLMKRFKLSFAALIAVVAIGLTITANAGMFKNTVVAPEDFCYTPASNVAGKTACDVATVQLPTLTCPQGQAYVNKPLYGISPANRITKAQANLECPGGSTFCCAEIEPIPSALCAGQPQFNIDATGLKFYRITVVRCQI